MKIDEQWYGKTLTISGFGMILDMDDKPKYPKLLQFAQVDIKKSDDCFKDKFDTDILKFPPKGWDKMKTQGFCYRGKKSEVNDCVIKIMDREVETNSRITCFKE